MHWAGICRHVWLSLFLNLITWSRDQVCADLCIAVVQGIPFKWRLCKIYWSDRWVFRVGFFHLQTASNQTTWIASVTNRANGRGWRLLLYPAQLNVSNFLQFVMMKFCDSLHPSGGNRPTCMNALYMYVVGPFQVEVLVAVIFTRPVESKSLKVRKSLKIGKNRIKSEKSEFIIY